MSYREVCNKHGKYALLMVDGRENSVLDDFTAHYKTYVRDVE